MLPILYSFRRCPYAMRARLAIAVSGIQVELREVLLKEKPEAMIKASPKGTVPVLIESEAHVIDESLDIMLWAFKNSAHETYWSTLTYDEQSKALSFIEQCDQLFKPLLDRYKYFERHPEHTQLIYRQEAVKFLMQWEYTIGHQDRPFLLGRPSIADLAIFPFIRQFAYVDKTWFDNCPMHYLKDWLAYWLDSSLFTSVMTKYDQWPSTTAGQSCRSKAHECIVFPK